MKNKYAFTMIELIFVIVILGILASVAIPKLAATRNDAAASKLALELGDCIEMAGGAYGMDESFDINSSSCKDVSKKNICFILTPNNSLGSLTVQHVAGVILTSICGKAQTLVVSSGLSSASGKVHQF